MPEIGQTLSHYHILRKLGQGGMGEVYLAQDTVLERDVALKFLPRDMRSDPVARERFLREARAVAALNHPHICVVHETSEVDGHAVHRPGVSRRGEPARAAGAGAAAAGGGAPAGGGGGGSARGGARACTSCTGT